MKRSNYIRVPHFSNLNMACVPVMCSSISLYLSQHSGLPVDFQIQQASNANAQYAGPRHALGPLLATMST